MQNEKKGCVTIALAFLVFSVIAIPLPVANAAGTITLSATSATPGTSITVSGAGFGATKAVGIGFGSELDVINETMSVAGPFDVAIGPYTGFVSYFPIKPGTFRVSININRAPTWSPASPDFGNGSLGDPLNISRNGTINYVTGQYTRFMNVPISSTNYIVHLVNYTRYQYNLTSASGVTTNSSGSFTTNIVVPNASNGNYAVTAVDSSGNIATSTLSVLGGNPSHSVITVAQAYNMIYGGAYPNLLIMDVRVVSDYNNGHIPGAINVPVIPPSPFNFTALYAWINSTAGQSNKNNPIIVYCGTGTRSNLTSYILDANGFTKVYDMSAAYPGWVAAGYPVVTPPSASTFCNVTVLPGWTWYFFVQSNGGSAPYTYQWYEGATLLQGQTSMVLPVTKTSLGTYTFYCKVTDSNGATTNSNNVTMTVFG